jgi:hypothetical protein
MALQFSDTVRNAMLDAIETAVGASPRLHLRTGAPPANCAARPRARCCATSPCRPTGWAAASGGSKAKIGQWSGAGAAAGSIGHYRIMNAGATVCHEQGTVTTSGGGGDMTVDNTSIAVSQAVTASAKTLNAPNG